MTTAGRVDYGILGPLEVLRDGVPVEVTARRQRTLLVCLLLRRREVVPTDVLMDALWGARVPPSAPNLVQVYVSQLRRVLPDDSIETRPPGYVLDAARDEVDADRFEDLLVEGRLALEAANPRVAASLLRRALALWRGSALAGFAYDDFAAPDAVRLEELRLVCLEERIAADLALGLHQDVLGELTTLVARHPHRERVCGHLMLALYRSGRQTEALDAYRALRRALRDRLGLEPSPELRELERAILRHDPALAPPPPSQVVVARAPTPATRLIGRERELSALRTLIQRRDVRLVTLAGAGGSGKTRLAIALVEQLSGLFASGTAVMELATLRDAELIVPALADTLGIAEVPDVPLARTLAGSLADQELLLVLDNLEHLSGCEEVIARLLAAAPRVTVVATSRRVLHISGEHVFAVQPLPQPDAVALFVDRARARDPEFGLSAAQEEAVHEICCRLDGLPLAIELAAARVRTLSPQELLERLVPRLTLLTGGPHDLPARQQTLRDTLAWSADVLAPAERRDLFWLGVFEGSLTLDAAEAVVSAGVDLLGTLVDHHLLQRVEQGGGSRYSMLETVREYALERLEAEGEAAAARERHATYYLSLALQRRREVTERAVLTPLTTLEPDHANLRAALHHFRETGNSSCELGLCAALWRFWWLGGHISEGRRQLGLALERSIGLETAGRAEVLRGAATLAHRQGDYRTAAALAEDSAELARALDETIALAEALMAQGNALSSLGDYDAAERLYAQSAEGFRAADAPWEVATLLMNMGDLALNRGDLESAEQHASESLVHFRRSGDDAGIGANLGNLAFVALERNDADRAFDLLAEALRRSYELGFTEWVATMLAGLAAVAVAHGAPARAACLQGAAARLREELAVSLDGVEARIAARTSSSLRECLDEETLASAFAEGRALSTADAVAVALSPVPKAGGLQRN